MIKIEKIIGLELWVIIPLLLYPIFKIKGKKIPLPENYASFERRLAAFIIDLVLIDIISVVLIIAIWQGSIDELFDLSYFGLRIAIYWIDFVFLTWLTGASVGKMIFKIKVIKKGGNKAGFIDLIYREIVKNVSFWPFNLGFLWMLISQKKLTWHDSVADTRVVRHINITKEDK